MIAMSFLEDLQAAARDAEAAEAVFAARWRHEWRVSNSSARSRSGAST
jgi:hypothetical protein